MRPLLEWFGRNGTWVMPAGVIIGLAVQPLAHLMRPLLAPSIFVMLTVILTRLDLPAAIAHLRKPVVLVLAILWAVVVLPVVFWIIVKAAGPSDGLAAALIIYATSPPNFAAAALAFVMGLDGAFTVAMIFGTTFLHPLTTPVYVDLFTGGVLKISGLELAVRLALMIGGASICAWLLRRFLGETRRARLGVSFDGINMMLMVIFVIALMAGIPQAIAARPGYAAVLALICFGLHIIVNAVTVVLFWWSGRRHAPTVGYCTGGRNIAIVMSVLGPAAPADAWLFFAVLQFPIYLLPVVLKPFYRRWLATAQPS